MTSSFWPSGSDARLDAEERDSQECSLDHKLRARVPAYLARRRADVNEIRRALVANDFGRIECVGHNLKGTGASYGFRRITEIGDLLESAAQVGSRVELEKVLADLSAYIQGIDPEIAGQNDSGTTHADGLPASTAMGGAYNHENKGVVRH